MSEKKKKRIRGSISIFLVIIMVPMICLSGLIVDISRVELAKANISSAGDLAMNSALANYDTVLKDVYGLFAMSQKAEDLEKNLYTYFTETLMANGIITSEADIKSNPLLQDIASAFSGQTSNLLSMEVAEDDFTVTKLEDSSLANPYVLKNQIVEYEKYRAPISSALSLLDGIAALKKIFNQTDVNKAKTEVDEKSGEVNEDGEALYKALKKYVEATDGVNLDVSTFHIGSCNNIDVAAYYGLSNPSTYKAAFEKVLSAYVRTLAESMPFDVYMTKNADGTYTMSAFRIEKSGLDAWSVVTLPTTLGDLYGQVGNNKGRWEFSKRVTDEEILAELKEAYVRINAGTIQDALTNIIMINDLDSVSLSIKESFALGYSMYMEKVRNVKAFYDLYMAQAELEELSFEVEIDGVTTTVTDDDITSIMENAVKLSTRLKAYQTKYEQSILYADSLQQDLASAIDVWLRWFESTDIDNLLEKAIKKLDDITESVEQLDNANEKLKTEIDHYNGSDSADAFSQQMQQDYEYYKDSIEPAKVAALKERLTNLRSYFKSVKSYLEGIKFMGKEMRSLNTLNNLVTETKGRKTSSGQTAQEYVNTQIDNNQDVSIIVEYFKGEYKEENFCPEKQNISIQDDPLWIYLQQAFGIKETPEDKEQEELKENLQESAKDSDDVITQGETVSGVTISDEIKALLPSNPINDVIPPEVIEGYGGEDTDFSSLFDRMSSAIGDLLEGMKKAVLAGRDNLYVSQYAFDMFTYNTMEAEYKFELEDAKDKEEAAKELKTLMQTSSGIEKNNQNNYMYGSEIEYLLYGGFDAKSNVQSTKSTIFCIRFLVNSGFALTNAEIRSITLTAALSIQAASMGVIPYKLTQTVLQLSLALAESSNDIRMMTNGEKVALVKTGDTWVMSPRGGLNVVKDLAKEAVEGAVKNAEKELTGVVNELIDKGSETVTIAANDFIDDMTITINGQVSELIGNVFSTFEAEMISTLDGYLKIGGEAATNARTIATDVIQSADSKAREIINSCSPQIKPIVEEFYNAYITVELDTYKAQIEATVSTFNSTDAGEVLIRVQQSISEKIRTALADLANFVNKKTKSLVEELADNVGAVAGQQITMAADQILNITNEYLDSTFNSVADKLPDIAGKTSNSSSLASALKFNYGNYLQIFLFLKLCINDTEVITRIADVIQLNVNYGLNDSGYTHPHKGKFLMTNAYTYVQIESDVKLKTLFLSLPFFTEYAKTGGSYFNLQYKSVLGY